jgi:hypothetical protein
MRCLTLAESGSLFTAKKCLNSWRLGGRFSVLFSPYAVSMNIRILFPKLAIADRHYDTIGMDNFKDSCSDRDLVQSLGWKVYEAPLVNPIENRWLMFLTRDE